MGGGGGGGSVVRVYAYACVRVCDVCMCDGGIVWRCSVKMEATGSIHLGYQDTRVSLVWNLPSRLARVVAQ